MSNFIKEIKSTLKEAKYKYAEINNMNSIAYIKGTKNLLNKI